MHKYVVLNWLKFILLGDVVFVMEKCDDGWFVGTSQRTGIFGTFPGNYVTQV